jgi:hypothetical protein
VAKKKTKKHAAILDPSGLPNTTREYPQVTARTSRDDGYTPLADTKKLWAGMGLVPTKIPKQLFDVVDYLTLTDPYVNKYHHTTIALANSGHDVTITASSSSEAQKAVTEINRLSERCFPLSGGTFGLVSGCLSQLARSGATCVEWVPKKGLIGIDQAFLVPIKTLGFGYKEDGQGYDIYQERPLTAGTKDQGYIQLNPAQTVYYNAICRDGNPYPIPPIISAIQTCGVHKDIIDKISLWMTKLSSLGVMIASVEPPPRLPGESQDKYDSKAKAYLDDIAKSVTANMSNGLGVGYNNIQFQFQNTQAGASGARDILQMVLQGVFAGLQRDPLMFGWSSGQSDAFVKVLYEELSQSMKFYQLGVSKVLELGYRLHLALVGMGGCSLSVKFRASRSLDQFRDSEAEYMDSKKILDQLTCEPPVITLAEARKKLGYDEQPTEAENSFTAEFSEINNSYKLLAKEAKIFPVSSVEVTRYDSYQGQLENEISKGVDEGDLAFAAWLALQLKLSKALVVGEGLDVLINSLENNINSEKISQLALKQINSSWNKAQSDERLFANSDKKKENGERTLEEIAAIIFLASIVEPFMVGNFISRSPWRTERLKNSISKMYDEYGMDNPTPDKIFAFKSAVSSYISSLGREAANHIGEVTETRAAAWAALYEMDRAKVKQFRVNGPRDNRKCDFCYAMLGKVFSVKEEISNINKIVSSKNPRVVKESEFITSKFTVAQISEMTGEEIQGLGFGSPPYHVNCRDWLEAL